MGIILAFAVGYVMGSNAGREGYQELVDSIVAVRDSEEFGAMLAALRSHAGSVLRDLSTFVGDEETDEPISPINLLERVRTIVGRDDLTSPAS
jgi:hypothetical protein